MVPSARLELALQKGTDFKSVVSTNFTTRALIIFMNTYAIIYKKTISIIFFYYISIGLIVY